MVNILKKALNKIIDTTKNAAGTISDLNYARNSDNKSNENVVKLAIKKAKDNYDKSSRTNKGSNEPLLKQWYKDKDIYTQEYNKKFKTTAK